jgi:hypothetical protein
MKTSTLPFLIKYINDCYSGKLCLVVTNNESKKNILKFYIYLHLKNEVIVILNDEYIFKMKYS